jgi:hypothetical protein
MPILFKGCGIGSAGLNLATAVSYDRSKIITCSREVAAWPTFCHDCSEPYRNQVTRASVDGDGNYQRVRRRLQAPEVASHNLRTNVYGAKVDLSISLAIYPPTLLGRTTLHSALD